MKCSSSSLRFVRTSLPMSDESRPKPMPHLARLPALSGAHDCTMAPAAKRVKRSASAEPPASPPMHDEAPTSAKPDETAAGAGVPDDDAEIDEALFDEEEMPDAPTATTPARKPGFRGGFDAMKQDANGQYYSAASISQDCRS